MVFDMVKFVNSFIYKKINATICGLFMILMGDLKCAISSCCVYLIL